MPHCAFNLRPGSLAWKQFYSVPNSAPQFSWRFLSSSEWCVCVCVKCRCLPELLLPGHRKTKCIRAHTFWRLWGRSHCAHNFIETNCLYTGTSTPPRCSLGSIFFSWSQSGTPVAAMTERKDWKNTSLSWTCSLESKKCLFQDCWRNRKELIHRSTVTI